MHFFNTTVTPQAIELVNKTMESTYLSEGAVARQFELALERELGLKNVVTVNSGTSALHLALLAAGVNPGDEVVTTAQTFIATSLAILYCGATPIYADIDPLTGNITADTVKTKVTNKTAAILPVMWGGYPIDKEIKLLGDRLNRLTVVDAAQGLGATRDGQPIGGNDFDEFTCFSTQAIKSLTTGDGGFICFHTKQFDNYLRRKRWFGIDRENDLPDELGERQYMLTEIGYKYHLNDFAASLGLGNLVGFKDRLARRREIAKRYFKELANVPGVTLMQYKGDRESAYWLFPIRIQKRAEFVAKLKSFGVPTSVVHQRIDKHPLFGGRRDDLPGLDLFDAEQIHIPMHDALTDDDVSLVIETIRGGW